MENVFVQTGPFSIVNVSEIRHLIKEDEPRFNPKDVAKFISDDKKLEPERIDYRIMIFYKGVRDPIIINRGEDQKSRDFIFAEIMEKMGLS
ncbi:MAG: hypothetical protein UY04_C0040G0003 [Parcubacteria group bacterium GW2011_GWA2_47_7]|nr:MAG: hypothetical protein UY04_C0040G0003 [Parcubacteria group bacterium GW2011_GWA2_47_7]